MLWGLAAYIFTGSTATVTQSQEPSNHNGEPPPNGHDPLHQGQEPLNLMREAIVVGEVCQLSTKDFIFLLIIILIKFGLHFLQPPPTLP